MASCLSKVSFAICAKGRSATCVFDTNYIISLRDLLVKDKCQKEFFNITRDKKGKEAVSNAKFETASSV